MKSELLSFISGKFVRPKVAERFALSSLEMVTDEQEIPDDGHEWQCKLTTISGVACILIYQDSKGRNSERLITCQRYDLHNDSPYLWGFCHMRKAVRQFKIDRIQEIFDPESGAAFSSVNAFFEQFAFDNTHKSKPGWGLNVTQKADFSALLNANVFMANCDEEFHPLERLSLENVITKYWLRYEVRHEPDFESIMRHVDKLAPDAETFWVALHRIAEDARLIRILKETVSDTIASDGIIADEEFYWGSKIDEFFQDYG